MKLVDVAEVPGGSRDEAEESNNCGNTMGDLDDFLLTGQSTRQMM